MSGIIAIVTFWARPMGPESALFRRFLRRERIPFAPAACAFHQVQSSVYAPLLHSRGVSWRSSERLSFRRARWTENRSGFSRQGTLAPPAGLRPRRAHEDRA